MAEAIEIEINPPNDEHGDMPFRLGDIVLDKKFGDLHPSLNVVDKIRLELFTTLLLSQNTLVGLSIGTPNILNLNLKAVICSKQHLSTMKTLE